MSTVWLDGLPLCPNCPNEVLFDLKNNKAFQWMCPECVKCFTHDDVAPEPQDDWADELVLI